MLEQLTAIYEMMYKILYKWICEIDITNYLEEVLGFLLIVLLVLIFRRTRKRRKIKYPEISKKDPLSETEPDFELIEDAKFKEEDEVLDEAETVADEIPEPEIVETKETSPAVEAEVEIETEVEPEPIKEPPEISKEPIGFFNRLKTGLSKTRQSLSNRFDAILSGNRKIDEEVLEEIEEVLITSDIGVSTSMALIERISKKADKISSVDDFKSLLKDEMLSLIDIDHTEHVSTKPYVIMVVGVNGVGKTTTIGKLAAKYTSEGKKVLLAAADTFRAAAVEQLEIWASRAKADLVKHKDKADPAAVAYDSIEAAIARDVDVVIVDTAGRLHTKVNLMEQLKKIKRSIGKKIPDAPHETLLILDATTGQNAVSQAKLFNEDISITGIVLTKLDGTAKGGIVLSISHSLNVPIEYIGIGEAIDDLQNFDPKLFIDALL